MKKKKVESAEHKLLDWDPKKSKGLPKFTREEMAAIREIVEDWMMNG